MIRFRSAATILETFALPKDGRYYKRLIAGFERIFYSTFYFANDEQNAETLIISRTSFRFVKDLKLWYFREDRQDQEPNSGQHENVIVLSEEFCREIEEHPNCRPASLWPRRSPVRTKIFGRGACAFRSSFRPPKRSNCFPKA